MNSLPQILHGYLNGGGRKEEWELKEGNGEGEGIGGRKGKRVG